MARHDPKTRYDGFQVITGGMNAGDAPNVIGRQSLANAINVTMRGGFPKTRPGWEKRTLSFPDGTTQTLFQTGQFQRAAAFQPFQGGSLLAVSISGRLFTIDVENGYAVQEVSIPGDLNYAQSERVAMIQANDFLIVANGVQPNLFYNGVATRRALPDVELPVATALGYVLGRVWGVDAQGKTFWASDLSGGSSGSAYYNRRDAVLKMTENNYLNGGGRFTVPFEAGRITGIATYANLDTSLGQGPVVVFTEQGAFSVQAPFDRTTWGSIQFPIQTVSLISEGCTSPESVVAVNGDLWYRSFDGVRSYNVARRDIGVWANTPMSFEVSPVLDRDDRNLLGFDSGIEFDNRLLMLCSPYRVFGRGVLWRGIQALDFSQISSLGSHGQNPVWDGLWTGLNIFQLVKSGGRAFALVLGKTNTIDLWELTEDAPYDNLTVPVACSIDTAAMNFEGGFDQFELAYGSLWADEMRTDVAFACSWWSDQYPLPIAWNTWTEKVKNQSCAAGCGVPPANFGPQFRGPMLLPRPVDQVDTINTGRNLRRGYEFQARLGWTGSARIKKFLIAAYEVEEDVVGQARPSQVADPTGIAVCGQPFTYSAEP